MWNFCIMKSTRIAGDKFVKGLGKLLPRSINYLHRTSSVTRKVLPHVVSSAAQSKLNYYLSALM